MNVGYFSGWDHCECWKEFSLRLLITFGDAFVDACVTEGEEFSSILNDEYVPSCSAFDTLVIRAFCSASAKTRRYSCL